MLRRASTLLSAAALASLVMLGSPAQTAYVSTSVLGLLTRANVWLATQVISTNATQTTDPTGGTPLLALIGTDGVGAQMKLVSYNSIANQFQYRYGGTAAAPAALAAGVVIGNYNISGYNGTAMGPLNGLQCTTIDAFTTSAMGTSCALRITPIGGTAAVNAILARSDGITLAFPLNLTKAAAAPTNAPGAGFVTLFAVAGTNSGSCKVQALAGTSTTPVTIVDNVGAGC